VGLDADALANTTTSHAQSKSKRKRVFGHVPEPMSFSPSDERPHLYTNHYCQQNHHHHHLHHRLHHHLQWAAPQLAWHYGCEGSDAQKTKDQGGTGGRKGRHRGQNDDAYLFDSLQQSCKSRGNLYCRLFRRRLLRLLPALPSRRHNTRPDVWSDIPRRQLCCFWEPSSCFAGMISWPFRLWNILGVAVGWVSLHQSQRVLLIQKHLPVTYAPCYISHHCTCSPSHHLMRDSRSTISLLPPPLLPTLTLVLLGCATCQT
jgi:hypothetical protein